jgi:hypothetical protein
MIGYINTTIICCLWGPQIKEIRKAKTRNCSSSSVASRTGRVLNASHIPFDNTKIAGKRLQILPQRELLKFLLLENNMEHEKEVYTSVNPSKASVTEQESNGNEARKALEQQRSRNPIASEMTTMEEESFKSGPRPIQAIGTDDFPYARAPYLQLMLVSTPSPAHS